jgi:hypothetical protein
MQNGRHNQCSTDAMALIMTPRNDIGQLSQRTLPTAMSVQPCLVPRCLLWDSVVF